MLFFFGLIFILWVEYFIIVMPSKESRGAKLLYCWVAGIELFCIMGFRSVNIGHDSVAYFNRYLLYLDMPWFPDYGYSEVGFRIFCKALSYFSQHPQIMFITSSAIIVFAVVRLIYKYAPNAFLGVLVYLTFGRFMFELGGIRQGLAMALSAFAFDAVVERRFLKFFLLIALASLFHVSAWLLLVMYPLYNVKLSAKLVFRIAILVVVLFFATPLISQFALSIFSRYSSYERLEMASIKTLSVITIAINTTIILLGWFALKMKLRVQKDFLLTREGKIFEYLFVLYLVGFCFYVIALRARIFIRPGVYFDFFNVVFIPQIFMLMKKDLMRTVILTCMISFILLENFIVITYRPDWNYLSMYEPFWQNMEGNRDKLKEAMAYIEAR